MQYTYRHRTLMLPPAHVRVAIALLLSLLGVGLSSPRANSSPEIHFGIPPSQQRASSAPAAPSADVDRAKTGNDEDSQRVTGVITQISCASGWRLQLDTPAGTLHLRVPANARLRILSSAGEAVTGVPCESLRGKRVTTSFKPSNTLNYDGTIETVELVASDEDANAGPIHANSAAEETNANASNPAVKGLAGDHLTAEGKVTDVTCNGNEMVVKVAVSGGQLSLHARDYSRLSYDDDRSSIEKPDFPACTELKGRTAAITYVVTKNRPTDGEMQSVEIEK